MTPSHFQEAIYSHLRNQDGNSAVVGVAGCGKTHTLIDGIGHVDSFFTKLVGTFTTSVRDEFRERGTAKGFKNTTYVNYNSFGWGICLRNMKLKPELDLEKTNNILEFVVFKSTDPARVNSLKYPITRLVSLFKALDIHTPEEAEKQYNDIVEHHNMDIPEDKEFLPILINTFRECINHHEHFDYNDQVYMPLHLGMTIPSYDQVFLDEFQDSSPLEMRLMLAAAKNGQFCALGDPDQTIYGFKGASLETFQKYITEQQAKELPLSICYRCPKSVIRAAQEIVPRIQWAPNAIEGGVNTITRDKFRKIVKPGDMVLCRTTDELVTECVRLIGIGVPAKVRGRDFGGALAYIIDKVSNRRDMPIADFITALTAFQFERIEQLKALRRYGEILALEDRCNTIKALGTNASSSEQIKAEGQKVFTDQPHPGVDLMTIHKAKGLQRKKVHILRPDLLPHPRSKDRAWMSAEECRLKYVGITRAEEELNWVSK
jgi:UvrD/REP helicase N-terminal domain/UvrD-like helicase C-terminal domain